MIGNFKSNNNTNTTLVNPDALPVNAADYLIDDVSLIELDLPAFAGHDTVLMLGDSLFLGREPDVGINDDCIWYKLPGTTPVDTIAGFWIKPTETCTYVVRQEICGLVKWDTVHVYMDALGLGRLQMLAGGLDLYPVPAGDRLELLAGQRQITAEFNLQRICNSYGELIREEEIIFRDNKASVITTDLPAGVYTLQLMNNDHEQLIKRFVISR
jgi:hypothetical protein